MYLPEEPKVSAAPVIFIALSLLVFLVGTAICFYYSTSGLPVRLIVAVLGGLAADVIFGAAVAVFLLAIGLVACALTYISERMNRK